MPRSYLGRTQQKRGEAINHPVSSLGQRFPEEENSLPSRSGSQGDQQVTSEVAPGSSLQFSWKKLWSQMAQEDAEGTQAVGHDTNSLYSEVTPGPCPGIWQRARGRPGFYSLQVLLSLTSTPSQGQDVAEWTLQQRLLGFLLRDRHLPHAPEPPQPLRVTLENSDPGQTSLIPPMLYLVRECLPMRTRRSFSVKFLSQGGYRRQWAAVRTQRSLMRLAPHSSS